MKIKNYGDNRQQLRELFYEIAADIKERNIESKFLKDFEIVNVQRSKVSYPAFRNRKGGRVISLSGGVADNSVELTVQEVIELEFEDHDAYHRKDQPLWWQE